MRTTFIAAGLVALTSTLLSAQQPVAPPPPICDLYNHSQDKQDGRRAAMKQHIYPWYAVGAGGGLLLPIVGSGIMTVVAFKGKPPKPDSIPQGMDDTCYREGFVRQARRERAVASIFSGLLGTAAGLIAVLALHADDAIVFPLVPGKVGNIMDLQP